MILLNDSTIAEQTSMSLAWVRQQRHLRKNGKPHTLTIDPIMIGTSPRYREEDVAIWIESLEGGNSHV